MVPHSTLRNFRCSQIIILIKYYLTKILRKKRVIRKHRQRRYWASEACQLEVRSFWRYQICIFKCLYSASSPVARDHQGLLELSTLVPIIPLSRFSCAHEFPNPHLALGKLWRRQVFTIIERPTPPSENEKRPLPIDLRRSKTSLLKFNITFPSS